MKILPDTVMNFMFAAVTMDRALSCSLELLDAEFLRTSGGLLDCCALKSRRVAAA
jgi:hypothetical protein